MEEKPDLGSRVCVLGLGVSGFESAKFLLKKGIQVFVSESSGNESLESKVNELRELGAEVETGQHTPEKVLEADSVIISPGIKPSSSIYQKLQEASKLVMSEIELAALFCPTNEIVAVTGTCGKTTFTTLLTRILKESGRSVVSCGNIGNPWIREVESLEQDAVVVLEVSSFQLANTHSFRPRWAVLLNISPNHLDWHESIDDYAAAKFKIFHNQHSTDFAYLQKEDELRDTSGMIQAPKTYLSHVESEQPNVTAVKTVASSMGCSDEVISKVLNEFEGLEHRLETVCENGGVRYVNDSKSTTVASLEYALNSYSDQKVILIAGGIAKSEGFETLLGLLKQKAKSVIVIGEAAAMLEKSWHGHGSVAVAETLEDAVGIASRVAQPEDVVLLSPGCASFDMFKNYEDRGAQFKQLVRASFETPESIRNV